MASITQQNLLKLAVGSTLLSAVATALFIFFPRTDELRGATTGVGFLAACLGGGIAIWFGFRSRDRWLALTAVAAVLLLAFWLREFYHLLHVNAA